MALYAIDDLDDAWDATREFLTPLSIRRLSVLAVIVFFVGGSGSSVPGGSGGTRGTTGLDPAPGAEIAAARRFLLENLVTIGLLVGAVLLVGLAFLLAGSVMEFVFVQSLRTDEVRFWGYAHRYFDEGLRLFGFRVALGIASLLSIAAIAGSALLVAGAAPTVELGGLLLAIAAFAIAVVLLVVTVVDAFTTAFVVPVMLVRNSGVLAAWRAFWRTLVRTWKQYLAYAIAAVILNVAAGIVFTILLAVVALALVIPLAVVVGATALLAPETVLLAVAVVLGLPFVLVLVVAALLIQVPIQTYLRYYALFVLGDTDATLDPIAEVRGAVRSADGGSTAL
ncbi:DUF7544 domain-containing protein [Halalkalicoccus salilacus]|uniref:DUF7544 domain-containing protein n=1 Tax=Halalkalicoccus salilacus TaxID=3117459 RepID=UPI00300F6E14